MKPLLLSAVLLCVCSAFAQKPFEGKITYAIKVLERLGADGTLTVWFAKPGIRLEFTTAQNPEKQEEVIVLNLDSGIVYRLNPVTETYRTSPLKRQATIPLPPPKRIAGQSTTPTLLTPNMFAGRAANAFDAMILHTADSLFYPIPAAYANNDELLIVNGGRVVLGAEFHNLPRKPKANPNNYPMPAMDAGLLASATAVTVEADAIADSLYLPPARYLNGDGSEEGVVYPVDSTQQLDLDSAVQFQQPAPPKKKKAPAKKKAVRKADALLRKGD